MKKRITAVIALIFFVLAAMAQVIPNGVYVIKYTESPSYALTLKGDKASDGNQIVAYEWQNKTSQMWEVENLSGGAIILRSVANNKLVINSKNNQIANNALIVTSSYTGINRQKWVPERQNNGSYVLMACDNKNFCLELKDGTNNAKNNGIVELWSTHKCNHQQWTFEKVKSSTTSGSDTNSTSPTNTTNPSNNNSGSTNTSSSDQSAGNVYYIKSAGDPNYVLAVNGKASNHQRIVIQKNQKTDAQKWRLTHEKDDTYALHNMSDEKFVISINDQLRGFAWLSEFKGSELERWKAVKMPNGNYQLLCSKDQNRALDIEAAKYAENQGVQLYGRHNDLNQQWIMERVDGTSTSNPLNDTNSNNTNTSSNNTNTSSNNNNTSNNNTSSNNNNTSPTTTTTSTPSSTVIDAPDDLTPYRDKIGQRFTFWVKARKDGKIWGGKNYIYTIDSDLATASLHAAAQVEGNVDKVVIEIVADQGSYPSITRNGIKSQSYKKAKGAFKVIGVPVTEVTDPDISKYRDKRGEMVKVRVTGRTTGTVYGKNSGYGYMDKSDLATAVVHATRLEPGETGTLLVRIKGPSEKHEAQLSHGIQSRNYGKSEGSFKIRSCEKDKPGDNSATQTSTTSSTNPSNNNSGTTTTTTTTTTKPSNNNSGSTNTSSSTPHEGNVYYIKSAGDPNYVLAVNGKASNHQRIVIQKNKKTDAQKWRLTHEKDDTYALRSMSDENFVISINDQLRGFAWLSEFKGSELERWKAVKMPNGNYMLLCSKDQNRALDIEAAKYAENQGVQLYGRHNDLNQQWIMERVDGTSTTKPSNNNSGSTTTTTTSKPSNNNSGSTNTTNTTKPSNNNSGTTTTTTTTKPSNNNSGNTNTSSSTQYEGNVYYIKSAGDPNYVVTVTDGKVAKQKRMVIQKNQKSNAQKWRLSRQKDGTYILRSLLDENYVICGNDQLSGFVMLNESKGSDLERWKAVKMDNGNYVLIHSKKQSQALDIEGAVWEDNATLQLYPRHNGTNQQWIMERADGSTTSNTSNTSSTTTKPSSTTQNEGNIYIIKTAGDPDYVITVNGKASNHLRMVIQKNKKSDAQKWRLSREKDGSYVLRSMLDEKYVISINDQLRGFLWLSEYSGSDLERWKAVKMDNGNYLLLLTKDEGRAIDVEGAKYEENRGIQLYGRHNAINQQWIMERVNK
ncbi:MAG: RICIN domain-containing protein [Bacteroidales bacterium]|nr:RICIN domain-containing protein [Bacteroidales bacterium]